ncbi:MAG TPA: glutamine amidotransferase [Chloroflexia bacterium]|nr:glutamine amidotransferase [Chloroflexia bacterium]
MDLHINFLYPDLMNIYGDRGNIIAMTRRAEWRGITVHVHTTTLGEPLDVARDDFYFFGGGQDRQQISVAEDLMGRKTEQLREAVEGGAVILSICGGYELLQHYYRPHEGAELPGVGLFDAYSVAGSTRFIGNVVVQTDFVGELVGFENHSGLTFLNPGCRPLGRSIVGAGNNGRDGQEGAIYKTAYGCWVHGSLLPKNPHFTDYLLAQALRRRHGEVGLAPLDTATEDAAHATAVRRAHATR